MVSRRGEDLLARLQVKDEVTCPVTVNVLPELASAHDIEELSPTANADSDLS